MNGIESMAKLENHQSAQTTKMLLIGDSGCLSWDSEVSVQQGTKPRKLTIQELFFRLNGKHHNLQQNVAKSLDTFLLSDVGHFAGMNKLIAVVDSGIKPILQLEAEFSGGVIRRIAATEDHKFYTTDGWDTLGNLKSGVGVHVWRNRGPGKPSNNIGRIIIHSIPYHPFGQANMVGGRDYKRLPRARLILEAAMNGLELQELVEMLRTDPIRSAMLQYIPPEQDVHHLDGDKTNDSIENLRILNKFDEHHEELIAASKMLDVAEVKSIKEFGTNQTYDAVMEGPHHNFIANGFVVHNSGKTGALASLAEAGYNLRIIDVDNGLDVLANLLRDPKSGYSPGAVAQVEFETITDPFSNVNGKLIPKKASTWQRVVRLLDNWKTFVKDSNGKDTDKIASDFGPISTWTTNDILVIDSLTMLSNAALNFILSLNARLGQQPQQSDWYNGQQLIEGLLQLLFDDGVKCNVIVNCHIAYIGEDNGPQHGYPASLGKALPPKIGRYFNSMLMAKTSGSGASAKRKITTVSSPLVELKTTNPLRVKAEYPIETGLADYFRDIRTQTPIPVKGTNESIPVKGTNESPI